MQSAAFVLIGDRIMFAKESSYIKMNLVRQFLDSGVLDFHPLYGRCACLIYVYEVLY